MCTLIAIYIFNIYIASGNETIVVGIKQNERCIHRGNICSIPANRYYKSRVPSKVIELALTAGCYVESIKAMNKRYGTQFLISSGSQSQRKASIVDMEHT